MPAYICNTCGAQFPVSKTPPETCPICMDERQYVPPGGQTWTTLDSIANRHTNHYRQYEPGLIGVGTTPQFCIGQRALIVRTSQGNFLWDCITLLDDATIAIIEGLGGLKGIAISHPHYYTTMAEWSDAFGGIPIYLHEDDRRWITRPHARIELWQGDTKKLADELRLIRTGGHFAGGTVAHWTAGAHGKGALLTGDIIMVIPDRRHVSFMRSYPNLIPLSAPSVEHLGSKLLDEYEFDAIYGAFMDRNILKGAKDALRRSVDRYIAVVRGDGSRERQ